MQPPKGTAVTEASTSAAKTKESASKNGAATTNGWKEGGSKTYGFNITSGSVVAGQVVYVGGVSMAPAATGTVLRKSATKIAELTRLRNLCASCHRMIPL